MCYKILDKKKVGFFLGLLENDGSIQVNPCKKRYLQFRVIIKMKYTPKNHEMLSQIRDFLGFFKIYIRNNFILLVENDHKQLKKLIKLIDFYGLLLTKVRHKYLIFKYALENNITYSEWIIINNNINSLPYKTIQEYSFDDIMKYPYLNDWLLGFIQAKSCFYIRKSGTHSFSISQKDDLVIIQIIKEIFLLPNKIQIKSNNLYFIESYNRQSIEKIIDFCKDNLKGEKKLQFNEFISKFYTI